MKAPLNLEPIQNIFVPEYRELSDSQKIIIKAIKDKAFELYQQIYAASGSDTFAADPEKMHEAVHYLEVAVMLAVKSVANPIPSVEGEPKVCPADCTEHTDHESPPPSK